MHMGHTCLSALGLSRACLLHGSFICIYIDTCGIGLLVILRANLIFPPWLARETSLLALDDTKE